MTFFTRARSDCRAVGAPTNAFVHHVYARLAPVYDMVFGAALQSGRINAVKHMALSSGQRILEVGVGTGLNLSLYRSDCHIIGIDLASAMLERAHQRVIRDRLSHVRLLQMDASNMSFADESFDVVCAPYLMSVVSNPLSVAREMRRVCARGGQILILNHFRSAQPVIAKLERIISPVTMHIGFRLDLELAGLLARVPLTISSIDRVNRPPLWSLVTCVNNQPSKPYNE